MRVRFYVANEHDVREVDVQTAQLQKELWSAVQTPAIRQQGPLAALAVSGMNDVINAQGHIQAAWWNRIPVASWIFMALIAVGCNMLVGYGLRTFKPRSPLLIILPVLVALAFLLIDDIDTPRHGLIKVAPKNLISLFEVPEYSVGPRLWNGDLLEPVAWTWGLSLIVLTIAIHAIGVVVLAIVSLRIRVRLANRRLGLRYVIPIVIGLVAAAGLLLAVLHGIEAAIWAAAYLWLGAIDSPLDAILYSVDSMSTRGASGLTLQGHWRMMGALEAVDGMLLFGISTAYIFALMQAYWPLLSRRH